ncbi:ABC transporter permease [Cohnella xylanilytica]|uniref:Abi family protein n=1 Tax=Cohnella xylanilytica TaxID=557555 RepID=UPI001B11E1E6|nr:Abi family protein [Cohnella xylanilytica]GIO15375.1 ABC transporter permease [Cohnella xylanilytica]
MGDVALKPPITFEEQVELLRNRGLLIDSTEKAISTLKRINYYRFTAYTLTFKRNDEFFQGVTFDTILRHYEFDSKLRNILMEIIEYVEVSFRTHIAYLLGHKYGPLGYLDPGHFRDSEHHAEFIRDLQKGIGVSKDLFVLHHQRKYDGKFPIWVAIEVLQFSGLSKLYKNLLPVDQRSIAQTYYGVHHEEIASWLYALTVVRNRCAHYNRLFNQSLPIKPRFRIKDKDLEIRDNYLFAVIFNLKYLITDNGYWRDWLTKLEALIGEYEEVEISRLGFREDWYALLSVH